MSVTLWIDTKADKTLELGPTLPVYKAFAELAHVVGEDDWLSEYPALSGVLSQCESQEDADPVWLNQVSGQANHFLRQYRPRLSRDALVLLEKLTKP